MSSSAGYKHLYRTPRWQRVKKRVHQRSGWKCQWPGCGKLCVGGRNQHNAPVAHHTVRHRGDETIFFDERNIVTVCKQCHDGPIQALEKSNRMQREDGWRP